MKKLGFLGLGNMGKALASGMLAKGALQPEQVAAFDPAQAALNQFAQQTGICACETAQQLAAWADCVVVAVKPHLVETALTPILPLLQGKMVVSIALGWDHARYQALLGTDIRVQFVMPNTPAMVGQGMLLFEQTTSLQPDELAWAKQLFSAVGIVETLPSSLMGAGGAVSGCGPAFVAMFIEALGDAGVKYGLPRATAYKLAAQTLAGTAAMQLQTNMHPGQIKDAVCSPGGSTILGVEALEKGGLRAACFDAVKAAAEKKT